MNNDTLSSVRPESVTKERHITAYINRPFSVAKGYAGSLSITPTSKATSVVIVSLKNSNTQRGKDYIDKLLEVYNINANNDKNEVAQKQPSLLMNVLVSFLKNWAVQSATWRISSVVRALQI